MYKGSLWYISKNYNITHNIIIHGIMCNNNLGRMTLCKEIATNDFKSENGQKKSF